jgi:hypothetical protein
MPRYFFDATDRTGRLVRDEVGQHLADDDAAWREALSQTRSIEHSRRPGGDWRMTVRESKRIVFKFDLTCIANQAVGRSGGPELEGKAA